MLTALTILSLDQGKIYSPPPDRDAEPTGTETSADAPQVTGIARLGRTPKSWKHVGGLVQLFNRLTAIGAAPASSPRQASRQDAGSLS
ncbi:hypothetical protein ASC97_19855 [Rhizobium sp. Root1203]|uniref:hypothetical protein n=1 Tax=Rhizobium sp. Root1203 TaxID=1736427 RepID=UPI00070F3372|nr:hypothetical protein [Rhizobium sp. Root1203]KQV31615.1 hypothetical protein ASC97_19855 [Rhizobium sp. Root1203]